MAASLTRFVANQNWVHVVKRAWLPSNALPVMCNTCLRRMMTTTENPNVSHQAQSEKEEGQDTEGDFESSAWAGHYYSSDYDRLYHGHIPITGLQRGILGVGSALTALYNPGRDDMICTLGETTGYYSLVDMRKRMLASPVGRQILEERPRINSETVDLEYLRSLPDGTFGKEYSKFLHKFKIHPDQRRPVQFVDDEELAYVLQRYREIHDLLHTLLGMPTNLLGEVVVKWVEALQFRLPMTVLGAMFGPLRFYFYPKHGRKFLETHLPWAIRNGMNATFFMNIHFESEWETPLADLRDRLNIEPPP